MILDVLIILSVALSGITCLLYLINVCLYREPPRSTGPMHLSRRKSLPQVSVLIPARNEESHIRKAVESVLANRQVELEVVVLDDHSTDATKAILRDLARQDGRVRWAEAPPLPPGWCGKPHACQRLAELARHPWLVFLDADVQLAPDALPRMITFMERSKSDLASGVPRQMTISFFERLLLPLIHFILLGFLPMPLMRWTKLRSSSAGCGQLFIARRSSYRTAGGHAAIRQSLHDGLTLPRAFREAGFHTDLFDATSLATCRMYEGNTATWTGLQKNATEGLAAPRTILVMSILLAFGQIAPFALACALPWLPQGHLHWVLLALACAWLPRWHAAARFRQSWLGAWLHPVGILLLLINQWQAWIRVRRGDPMVWRDRQYAFTRTPRHASPKARPSQALWSSLLLGMCLTGWLVMDPPMHAETENPDAVLASEKSTISWTLKDQYDRVHRLRFPRTNAVVLVLSDRAATTQLEPWIRALRRDTKPGFDIYGIASLKAPPSWVKSGLVRKFRASWKRPVLLDWGQKVTNELGCQEPGAHLVIMGREGNVLARFQGRATEENLAQLRSRLTTLMRSLPIDGASEEKALEARQTKP